MSSQSFGGEWTDQKLQILDEYLAAYCRIFQVNPAARHFETIYVDAFAGGGLIQSSAATQADLFSEFAQEDTINLLQGSAARALRHPFDRYVFIEKSDERIAELEKLRTQSAAPERIVIRQGDANSKLERLANATDWKKTRAVVFLDPYGMQVNWNTIEMLGETKAVDLWLLFPLGQAVMRLLQKRAEPPPEWQQALDRIFGTHEWSSRFYKTEKQDDFFEEVTSTYRVADSHAVSAFMIEQLEKAFFAVAKKPGTLYNSQRVPLYLFCFASANPKGAPTALKIANYLLKRLN
jgi:three-Cys-motif partner protein